MSILKVFRCPKYLLLRQLCALWPKVNLQSPPGGKTSIVDILRSSHPEGKCTTAKLKPHQEALKRGPALLNGSQDHPTADTADYSQVCQGWSKVSSIHHLIATNYGQKSTFSERSIQARTERRDLIQKVF